MAGLFLAEAIPQLPAQLTSPGHLRPSRLWLTDHCRGPSGAAFARVAALESDPHACLLAVDLLESQA